MRTAWELYDPVTLETYVWPVNPHTDNGSHAITKRTGYEVVAGLRQSGGDDRIDSIVFGNGFELEKFAYEGKTYSLAERETLEDWATRDYDVILKDDLGREYSVLIESIVFSRLRSVKNRFKQSYTLSGIILEEL